MNQQQLALILINHQAEIIRLERQLAQLRYELPYLRLLRAVIKSRP